MDAKLIRLICPGNMLISLVLFVSLTGKSIAGTVDHEALFSKVHERELQKSRLAWIFFDRRDTSPEAYRTALDRLDEKAVSRRIRARGYAVGRMDLPPHPDDLDAIQKMGFRIRTVSRWLNATSVEGDSGRLRQVASLDHVLKIQPVATGQPVEPPIETGKPAPGSKPHRKINDINPADYGLAWAQDSLIGAPEAHEMGYTGEGVRVGFLDSGFSNYDGHVALEHLVVAGTWSAHDSTEIVDDHCHGVKVLSVAAAKDSGNMIGVAPDIEVLLVKTEDPDSEYIQEEDYWVAGLEWTEEHGADLVSTSLGYYDWYSPEDMDGNTAITTIAADLAAARGLLVITSAGNRGLEGLGAPADGDSVLAVGGTDSLGYYVFFSSVGPTADGRIKPDVAARALDVIVLNDTTPDEYIINHGTSFSCPAAAGAAAILLQADPELLPLDLINALRNTASNAATPDTLLGWGVINIPAALLSVLHVMEINLETPRRFSLDGPYPNPTNSSARIVLRLPRSMTVDLLVFNILGRETAAWSRKMTAGTHHLELPVEQLPSGLYPFTVRGDETEISGKTVIVK